MSELAPPPATALDLPYEAIAAFCRRWRITELALFGSVLRDDFGTDSDIDVLVTFEPDAPWGLLELAAMQREFAEMVGRTVDVVEKADVLESHNWIRRRDILDAARVIYAVR